MATWLTLPPGSQPDASRAHVVLVGLPGSGKTTVGRLAAERLGRPFLDFDAELERRTGTSIPEIFARRGEPAFRQLELALTREVAGSGGMILAPGGGWAMVPGAVALLRPPARMIYLRVSPAVALRRMGATQADRPLLRAADPLAELHRLLERRAGTYALADLEVDTEAIDIQGVVNIVARLASTHGED